MPSVQHDSEAAVGEKRLAPDNAQDLPGPSVGVFPLHMIEEETTGEDGDHASSPPCSGQELSVAQYGMNTLAKAAQMLAAPALDLQLQKVLLENKQRGGARQESALE